jgi:cytochrome c553
MLSCLVGCAEKVPDANQLTLQADKRTREHAAMQKQMHTASFRLKQIKRAIVAGDLASVQAAAGELGKLQYHPITPGLATYSNSHVQGAAELEEAADLSAAAGPFTRLSMECGECHAAESVVPAFSIPKRPKGTAYPWANPEGTVDAWGNKKSDEGVHTTVHLWGVDRMWESLMRLAPADESWTAGVSAFVKTDPESVDPSAVPEGMKLTGKLVEKKSKKKSKKGLPKKPAAEPRSPERQAHVDRLDAAIAPLADGAGPTDPAARAQILGEILTACAGCHQLPAPEKDEDGK